MVKSFPLRAAFWGMIGFAALGGCMPSANGARFLGGDVMVVGPNGYCLDAKASRQTQDRAVALLGKCAKSSRAAPAVITVSLGDKGSGSVLAEGAAPLAKHLQTAAGRASVARNGKAGSVRIDQLSVVKSPNGQEQLIFHVQDRSSGPHWRAIFALKGRLSSVSVFDPQGQNLEQGRRLLIQSVAALLHHNALR